MSNSTNTKPLLSVSGKLKPYTFESIQLQCKPDIADDKIVLDLLIEGYIRTECHLDTDYNLFPFGIKQMIASYYRFDLTAYIKSKQERKKLEITTKLQTQKYANYWSLTLNKNIINIFFFCVSLVISIVAIVIVCIAYYNESNHCNNNYSIIDPTTFILIGGSLCLSHALFIGLHRFIASLCFHIDSLLTLDLNAYLNDIKKRHKWLYLSDIISKWIMLIFYLVWSIIGFYIFDNEMSHHCMQSNIAKTMISWSVIIFILAGYYYVSHSLRMIFTESPEINDNDADYTMVLKQKIISKKKLFCFFVPFITLSIFLLIMSQSKDVLCNQNYSILKPTYFTIIGGSVVMLHIVFILFIVDIAGIVSWIVCIFYFVWSILGFYIYHNQLSSDCVETFFATLFIVWSILLFIISFIYHIQFAWTTVNDDYQLRIRILKHIICTYPLLFLSVAVTIVGIYGDETVCNTHYNQFALIAGILDSTYFIIAICTLYTNFNDMYGVCGIVVTLLCKRHRCAVFMLILTYYVMTFGIPLFMYGEEMPKECKQDILGQMIIARSVIMFILGICYTMSLLFLWNELMD